MGKNNRFREDALKYWDIKCEDAWTRFEEAVRENPYLTAKEFCAIPMPRKLARGSDVGEGKGGHLPGSSSRQVGEEAVTTLIFRQFLRPNNDIRRNLRKLV